MENNEEKSCIFCKIIKGEIPSIKIYENSFTIAFLDISPINKGHVLVISKKHYETILDIPEDLLKEVISAVKRISKAIKDGINCNGISIIQSNFKAGGQVVPHLHFHIIPRYENDNSINWPKTKKYKEGEAEDIAKKIKNLLK